MSKSDHFNSKEIDLKNGAIAHFWPPLEASRMKAQSPFGAAFITVGLPCIFWGGHDLGDPGPHKWVQAIKVVSWTLGQFMVPIKFGPRGSILVLGASNSPHGPQTIDHGVRPTDRKTTYCGPRTIGPQRPEKGQYGHIS
ncbi:hypothetical protein O181_123509 [Austropuccinia psidii MF-1]|uniref:Uncharacterized protein n=1 Tax=Austropuccinia psidii MF-1 TaxID=1389203 RepID=A0A9Q3KQ61_9BASI|nr:hypothetical protein [Austropuccinia psidii MF-1]